MGRIPLPYAAPRFPPTLTSPYTLQRSRVDPKLLDCPKSSLLPCSSKFQLDLSPHLVNGVRQIIRCSFLTKISQTQTDVLIPTSGTRPPPAFISTFRHRLSVQCLNQDISLAPQSFVCPNFSFHSLLFRILNHPILTSRWNTRDILVSTKFWCALVVIFRHFRHSFSSFACFEV